MKLKKLLSVFLALAMLLGVCSVPVFADGNVAKIGAVEYASLAEAVAAANAGTSAEAITITLLQDAVMSANVQVTSNIILDLNGHAITSAADDLFDVQPGGTLTVNDSVGGGSIYTDNWTVLAVYGGTVVVNAGKIGASKANTAYSSNGGSITFNGGMINQSNTYYTVAEGLRTYDGVGANVGYYIFAAPTVTAVTPSAVDNPANNQQQFTATVESGTTVVWSSSDETVATVDQNGLVTTTGTHGMAYIYATDAQTGAYAYASVAVGDSVVRNERTQKGYASLQAAVLEAESGDTIKLLNSFTLSTLTTFPAGKTLTLDLGGKTLTENASGPRLLDNYGTLTITNGTISQTNADSFGAIRNSGTLTLTATVTMIDNGGASGSTVNNYGSGAVLTVEGGSYTANNDNGKCNGVFNVNPGSTATISNATVVSANEAGYGVYSITNRGGTLTLNDGVNVTATRGALANNAGQTTVNGGTYTVTGTTNPGYAYFITNDGQTTNVVINGGTFTSTTYAVLISVDDGAQDASDVAVTINGGYFNQTAKGSKETTRVWDVQIKGGYFKTRPAETLLASGYEVSEITEGAAYDSGYHYTVVNASNVARIGNTDYASLAAAIAAVPTDGTVTTIVMLADETIENVGSVGLVIPATKNIVLDLNGKTISGASNLKSTHFIDNKGTLEITDSSANEDGKITFCAVADTGYSVENITIYNIGGRLTLTKGTIENTTDGGLTYAVNTSSNAWGTGDDKYSVFTMTGGRLAGAHTDNTLRVYQNCAAGSVASHNTVNISGGVIDNGIFVDTYLYTTNIDVTNYTGANIDTVITISGGTVNGLVDMKIRHPFNTVLNITGGDFTNATLQVRKHGEYNANFSEPTEPMVNISGGRFAFADTSKSFLLAYDSTTSSWETYSTAYSITGGKFNLNPTYVAEGYEAVPNTDDDASTYGYKIGTAAVYVASITRGNETINFESAQEAFDAAVSGDVITLFAGDHGTLYIRQNSAVSVGVDVKQQQGEDWGTNDRYRALSNVTIQGQTGATVNKIVVESGAFYAPTNPSSNPEYTHLDSIMEIDDLLIKDITFNLTGGPAFDVSSKDYLRITGLTFDGCTVNGTGNFGGAERLIYATLPIKHMTSRANSPLSGVTKTDVDFTTGLSDFVVTNCVFNDLHQVMEIRGVTNLTFTENTMNGVEYQTIIAVSDKDHPVSIYGTVTIADNTIEGTSADRVFRFDKANAEVSITGNTITDYSASDRDLIKISTSGSDAAYTVTGNSWQGSTSGLHVNCDKAPTTDLVAKIGSNKYFASLADAIAAATAGATIELIADVDLTDTQIITKNLTIDLNGQNITATGARALWVKSGEVTITGEGTVSASGAGLGSSSSVIRVGDSAANNAKAKLIVNADVTVSSDKCYGISVFGVNDTDNEKTTADIELEVYGTVAVTGTASAISGNGTSTLSATTMKIDGTVSATQDYAIYHPGKGELYVYGTVTGLGGIEAKGGNIFIGSTELNNSGVSITATAQTQTHSAYNNGASTSGYAIAAVSNAGYAGQPVVTIYGNVAITGQVIYIADNDAANNGVVQVLNSTTGNISIPADYKWEQDGDSRYVLKEVEVNYVAQIGDAKYETLQDAVDAATDGQTIILLEDITLTKDVHVTTSGENIYCVLVDNVYKYQRAAKQLSSLTIDGNGHAITMDANAAFADKYHLSGGCAFFFGKYGTTGEVEGNYTIRNVTFEGFNTEIIRSAFTTVNLENCTFNGNHITVVHGDSTTLLYAYQGGLNVSGCTFTDNTVSGIYGLIFSNNSNSDATITIDHNLFKNNGTSAQPSGGNGLIYLSNAASSTDAITNNTFEGNYVQNASANAAVVYLSKPVETFSGNLFKDNHVDVSDSSKKEGIIVLGSSAAGTPVVGNAFDGNVLVSELPAKRATIVVGCNSDLSSNYWGDGAAAVEGAGNDYYIDGSNKTITITGFATAYAANANANGCTVSVPSYVAQIGDVQYTTLVDAIAAANADTSSDPITITLLADLDFSDEVYAGYKWGNFLAITRSNVTLDLDGHTISNMGNAALAFGYMLAVNGRISNVTIQNGTLLAGQTDGVTNSYVLGIGGVDGALIKNVTTIGGINVYSGSKDIVIDSCSVTGTKYYTVCAQTGSDVIIRGTSYTKNTDTTVATKAMFWIQGASTDSDMVTPENLTGAFGASSITIESGSFAIATAEGGQFYLTGNGYLPPVVKGGIFNIEVPAVCIADGYEAVGINKVVSEITYIKQVGKVIASTNLTPAVTPTAGYDSTYTVQKKVVDEGSNNQVIATGTSREVNVKVVTDGETVASENNAKQITDNLKMDKVLDSVVDAVADANDTLNVHIQVVRDTPPIVENTITYEVHPIALIYVNDATTPTETVTITNDKLESGALFTITLPVPDALAELVLAGNGYVKVTHRSADYVDTVMSYPLLNDNNGHYYVQFKVSHFSKFELAVDTIDTIDQNNQAKWGASLILEDMVAINLNVWDLKDRYGNDEADPSRFTVKYTFRGETKEVALTGADNDIIVANVAAKELVDEVTLELYYDGVRVKGPTTYSARTYCQNKIAEAAGTKLDTLCRALLEYGAAAQERFNYKTDDLANKNLNVHAALSDVPAYSYVKNGTLTLSASLSLKENTQINVYFLPAAGCASGDYTATVGGQSATITASGSYGYIAVPGIAAKNLGDNVTVVITRTGTDEKTTLAYSPMTWAYNKQGTETTELEYKIARTLYAYYLAAAAYFASSN